VCQSKLAKDKDEGSFGRFFRSLSKVQKASQYYVGIDIDMKESVSEYSTVVLSPK
jgi:hypothetical protein